VTIIVSVILAWMTSSKSNSRVSTEHPRSALIQLGQSHYYSLTILNRALIGPLHLFCENRLSAG